MRQIEDDDASAVCPDDSNLTALNVVNCRGDGGGGGVGIVGIVGENGMLGGVVGVGVGERLLMKGKVNHATTTTTSTTSSTSSSSTTMRRTKRSPNERRFKCDQCDRMFFTRKDVKRHLVVHTGVRNYACPFCQQRFGRKDHLVRHAKKSHQKDTRASAASNLGANGSSPMNRRITFTHSPVHGIPTSPAINHPGRMIVNVNNNNHCNNSGSSNASHSPCNYSSSNVGPVMDQSSPLMLLGSGGPGSGGGGGGLGCNGNGNGIVNNNHHDICYPGNAGHHNGSMPGSINDGHFGTSTMGHASLCETSLFNNGGHYFSLGAGPTPFMNPAYITNCFGHITVNPGNTGGQGLSMPPMCSDQTSPVSYTNALPHYSMDVNLSNHLPHFNQVFQ